MIFFIGFLALVSTQTLYLVNAKGYAFDNIRIPPPIAPKNDILTLATDPPYRWTYEKKVNELLINATVTYLGSGDVLYNGELLNICDKQEDESWDKAVVELFKFFLVPPKQRRSPLCPIKAESSGEIYKNLGPMGLPINDTLNAGDYEFSYSAQADSTVILSSLLATVTFY